MPVIETKHGKFVTINGVTMKAQTALNKAEAGLHALFSDAVSQQVQQANADLDLLFANV